MRMKMRMKRWRAREDRMKICDEQGDEACDEVRVGQYEYSTTHTHNNTAFIMTSAMGQKCFNINTTNREKVEIRRSIFFIKTKG